MGIKKHITENISFELIFNVMKKSIWLYAGSVVGIGFSFLTTIIITRLIAPGELGIFGNFLLLSGMIGFLTYG